LALLSEGIKSMSSMTSIFNVTSQSLHHIAVHLAYHV
jgi:hypothetical protein